jgi:allantoicase
MSTTTPDGLRGLTDLASLAIGGRVIYANDELFADRRHLIDPAPSDWQTGTYGRDGKIYDGWETRRRRDQPGQEGHDFGIEELHALTWTTIVAKSPLKGDTANGFDVDSPRQWTHLRLSIFPDGGVARFRALGEAVPDPRLMIGTLDLAAMQHGGTVVSTSNMFYSSPHNLIRPGDALTIAEGWETARRRGDGNDWVLFKLGAAGHPRVLEIDTTGFTGNSPGWARLRGIDAREYSLDDEDSWIELLPRNGLLPDTVHKFRLCDHTIDGKPGPPVTHVRLDVYPDGGMGRVRLYGEIDDDAALRLARRWLVTLPPAHLKEVLGRVPGLDPEVVAHLTRGATVSAIEKDPLPEPLRAYLLGG